MKRGKSILFSFIILTKNRPRLLKKCLSSIFLNSFRENFEIMVINTGKKQDFKNFSNKFPIKIINAQNISKGKARNLAIFKSRGQYLYFLDDDVEVTSQNLKILKEDFAKGAQVVGGPNLTPPKSSFFEKANGWALGSLFGSGPMVKRYVAAPVNQKADQKSLILCNMAIEKKVLTENKVFFDERIICNEENLLIWKLQKLSVKIVYTPKLIVYHKRRDTFKRFFLQVATYGAGRFQQTLAAPNSVVPATLVAPTFIIYLLLLPIAFILPVYLLPLIIYAVINLVFATAIAFKNGAWQTTLLLFALFPTLHIGYGLGFLLGAFKKS